MSSSTDPPTPAPALYGTDSGSRLVLLSNTDEPQEYATDDEDEREVTDTLPGITQPPIPPLPPSVVFLYLLSPYLRLGAIYVSDIGGASLAYCLAGLVVAATLSAFCRQIWFLLGRYLRKSSTEDILIYTFARRHRRMRKYGLARHTFTLISASFNILLAAMYLRGRFVLQTLQLVCSHSSCKQIPSTLRCSLMSQHHLYPCPASMFQSFCLFSYLYSLYQGRWRPSLSCTQPVSL